MSVSRDFSKQYQTARYGTSQRFFDTIIRIYCDNHNSPHLHAKHQENKAPFDFDPLN